MTIRNKTLLIIGVTLLVALAVIYSLSASILNANLAAVEEQNSRENVYRVKDAIDQKLNGLNTTTISYSQWTETCVFLRNQNHKYFAENFAPEALTTLKINLIALVGDEGNLVFGTNHDLKKVRNYPLDRQILSYLQPESPLLKHSSTRSAHMGILPTTPNPLLVVTRPIVNDMGGGPIQGTMVTGIYLTPTEVKNLSSLTHLSVALQYNSSKALPADFREAKANLNSPQDLWVHAFSSQTVSGYQLLPNIFQEPTFLLRVDAHRDIFNQGQLGIHNVIVALVLSGLISCVVTLLLLERLVLSRVTKISQDVASITQGNDFSQQIAVEGRDELSALSINVNGMIQALHASLLQEENNRRSIESSLREKDVLLKELYHRVKNNLQIISSLLSLQMDGVTDPKVCEMFDESRNRVRSMALVHEKLYQSNDLGSIDFGEYLENLARSLLRTYSNRAGQIALELHCEAVQLDIDHAVPCGLIVNELVTNSLKYAFPDNRLGTIEIELKALEDGQFCLKVSDDGIGIPSDFNIHEASSIGMQLVTGLTQQLEGNVQLSREKGTQWIIVFKGHHD